MNQNKLPLTQRICYAPLGALLWLLSKLPFCVLYAVADFIAFIAYRVVKYRVKVVRRNLEDSFPEKTAEELRSIEAKFYSHLSDYFVETIKLPAMTAKQMKRRMRFENTELIDRLFAQGKSMIIYTSHFGNWEWITSVAEWCQTKDAVYAHVYKPLRNKWFDNYFLRIRGVYNHSIPMQSVLRQLVEWRKEGVLSITGFLSDQCPRRISEKVVVDFLGRPTAFIAGTEEIARKFKMPVLYFDTRCEARGYYVSRITLLSEDASLEQKGRLTEKYAQYLESSIRTTPEAYLWSHNRWGLNRKNLK